MIVSTYLLMDTISDASWERRGSARAQAPILDAGREAPDH